MAQNTTPVTIKQDDAALAASAATIGDLSQLSDEQRTQLYGAICRSVGLNPITQPFAYIKLNNKLTLYATKGATDQLRKINGVTITNIEKDVFNDVLMVTVTARDATGRQDTDIGAVAIKGLSGEALANAYMKAITKGKRRVTLSITGLGFLDESEVSSIPNAEITVVDPESGEIQGAPAALEAGAIERPEPGTDGEWNRASASLHAWGKEVVLNHSDIHYAAQALFTKRNIESITDLSVVDLRRLRKELQDGIQRDPQKFWQWMVKITPSDESTTIAEAESDGRLPGVDDHADERSAAQVAEVARR